MHTNHRLFCPSLLRLAIAAALAPSSHDGWANDLR